MLNTMTNLFILINRKTRGTLKSYLNSTCGDCGSSMCRTTASDELPYAINYNHNQYHNDEGEGQEFLM